MGLIRTTGGSVAKPFPRIGAFCIIQTTGDVGIIHQYPQQNGGGQDKDGSPIITFDSAQCEVHALNEDGTTKAEYRNVPIADVRIAKVKEVPRSRRMSDALAKKYGYV